MASKVATGGARGNAKTAFTAETAEHAEDAKNGQDWGNPDRGASGKSANSLSLCLM
jgi:hypothetical protein